MMILAAAAGLAASAVIYSIEDLVDKSICKSIDKKKQQSMPAVPAPPVMNREAELEAQIAQLQAALVQQQPAPQPQQAPVVQQPAPQPVQVVTVAAAPAPVEEAQVGFKTGDKVVLSDTAQAIQGQLPPNEKTCVIDKINDDGTMVVIFRIGNSRRRCTVSEYDVFPAD